LKRAVMPYILLFIAVMFLALLASCIIG